MFAVFVSLFALFMAPTVAPATSGEAAAPVAAAERAFDWLDGTWRNEALEMRCAATPTGMACREEGRGEAMKGAVADLTLTAGASSGASLKVALPTIPPSTFVETGREARSVTFEMPTPSGTARLRFSREGDVLTVERGSDKAWGARMVYQKGG